MRRKLPPLNALLAFEAAARHGSFTRAAHELGVAQPAVTRHIANLESWVDAPLFSRRGNAVALTEAGTYLADLTIAAFDRIELGLRDVPMPRSDELLIGASFGVTHLWLMPRITALRGATSATLNFVTSEDYRAFDGGAADMSIRFGNGTFPGHNADLLFPEDCRVLASPEFLENHPSLDPENLPGTLAAEWLLDHGDPYNIGWMTWSRWFAQLRHPDPVPAKGPQVRYYPAMLDMVCHGEGLALGSAGLDDDIVEAGRLVRLGPTVSREGYGYYLVYADDACDRPGFDDLRRLFLSGELTRLSKV